jgi:hypothetical protein
MIWLTWRQFRASGTLVFGALVILAVVLAVTGPNLVHSYDTHTATCKLNGVSPSNCGCPDITADAALLVVLTSLILVGPALIGIFWGAPLIARELETGTYRLGWTQSVTRRRWLAVRLGVVGLGSVVAAGLLTLMVDWWSSPIERVNADRFAPAAFGLLGITPIGYAAFAFAPRGHRWGTAPPDRSCDGHHAGRLRGRSAGRHVLGTPSLSRTSPR